MKPTREQRVMLQKAYENRTEALEHGCFGDCCLTRAEKEVLVALIYDEVD